MMQAAAQAMATGQPPKPPEPHNPQEPPTRKGPGMTKEAKNAMSGGDLPPNSGTIGAA
jgi:hypothetical protein